MPDLNPSAPPLLAARGLSFARNDAPVFGPLSFDVDGGEALLVQGGNGAGKTTLLRVLAGLLRADSGTVDLDASWTLSQRVRRVNRAFGQPSTERLHDPRPSCAVTLDLG